MRPNRQYSTAVKIIDSKYHSGKFTRTISMKIFIEIIEVNYVNGGGKVAEAETPGQDQEYCRIFFRFLSSISKYIAEKPAQMQQQYSRQGQMVDS